jgi:hypothetical protein
MNQKIGRKMKIERIYEIKFNYKQGKSDPFTVFSAYAEIINSFKEIDKLLGKSICSNISCKLTLEDVTPGSIISKIKAWLDGDDGLIQNTMPDKNNLQEFVNEGTKVLINTMNDTKIESREQINDIQGKIEKLAVDNGINNIITYIPLPTKAILKVADGFAKSVNKISENESIQYHCNNDIIPIRRNIEVYFDKIQEELINQTIISEGKMILKIKNPDLLENKLWTFKHDKPIQARIADSEWLNEFFEGKIPLFSGDSFHATVKTIAKYDKDGNLIKQEYVVTKVEEITGDHNG